MIKWLFNILKFLVIVVLIFFALQLEYRDRKIKTYIVELPDSIIARRAKYYISSIFTGKKDVKKEEDLFGEQEKKTEDKIPHEDSKKLKSVIISN